MINSTWDSPLQLDVISIIEQLSINGLRIGSSISQLLEVMGKPELPAAKLSKKSKIVYWLYGNVSFLSEDDSLIAIDVDFHSNRKKIVKLGEIVNWKSKDWLNWAQKRQLNINKQDAVINISDNNIIITLSQDWSLGMVSIRGIK